MPEWFAQSFVLIFLIGVPVLLVIGAVAAWVYQKKQESFLEDFDADSDTE